tara:strand:- start:411 stop:1409 length:999 start_codon:yes stop_codon:yes gene_type:complete
VKKIKKVKIAVVGVGHLGKHHVRHYSKLENAELVGVFDVDQQISKSIAEKYKIRNFKNYNELIEHVDAVSIVTPTKTHYEVSKFFLYNKKHVLIEKPITSTVAEADDLIKIANSNNVLIQVGHIERFNPALFPLRELELDPKYLEIQRLAPYTSRGTDVPVVLDLMIHDIDLALSLVSSNVKSINANGVSIMTNSIDIANARLKFENGTIANITSSRIAKDKVRKIKLFQQDLYITIDFLASITEIYRAMDLNQKDEKAIMSAIMETNGKQRQIFYEKPEIQKRDALKYELINFVNSIQKKEKPLVGGVSGRNALEIAMKIQNTIIEDKNGH